MAVSYLPDVLCLCNEDAGKSIVNFYVSLSDSYFLTPTRPRGGGEGMGLGKKKTKKTKISVIYYCISLMFITHLHRYDTLLDRSFIIYRSSVVHQSCISRSSVVHHQPPHQVLYPFFNPVSIPHRVLHPPLSVPDPNPQYLTTRLSPPFSPSS